MSQPKQNADKKFALSFKQDSGNTEQEGACVSNSVLQKVRQNDSQYYSVDCDDEDRKLAEDTRVLISEQKIYFNKALIRIGGKFSFAEFKDICISQPFHCMIKLRDRRKIAKAEAYDEVWEIIGEKVMWLYHTRFLCLFYLTPKWRGEHHDELNHLKANLASYFNQRKIQLSAAGKDAIKLDSEYEKIDESYYIHLKKLASELTMGEDIEFCSIEAAVDHSMGYEGAEAKECDQSSLDSASQVPQKEVTSDEQTTHHYNPASSFEKEENKDTMEKSEVGDLKSFYSSPPSPMSCTSFEFA